jgi:hypothetical protein
MKTIDEFQEWCAGARAELGDPSLATGIIFARYLPTLGACDGADIAATYEESSHLILYLVPDGVIRLAISIDGPEANAGQLLVFGVEAIAPGLWTLFPSVNLPDFVHAFVVLYDVPEPAPWDRRIIFCRRIPAGLEHDGKI